MYNTKAVELEKNLIELINNSNVHVCTVKYILEKISRMTNDALVQEIKKEKESANDTNECNS